MIYTWLFYEFTSDQGTTYRVNINADEPTPATSGEPRETSCRGDGFVLEYDGRSQDPFQPIVGSKVTAPLLIGTVAANQGEPDATDEDSEVFVALKLIEELNNQQEGFFTLEIRKDPDGDNDLFWAGVILGEQTIQNNEPFPRDLTLTAVDDLANLEYVDYEDFDGAESFRNAIIKILRQTRMADKYWTGSDLFISMQHYFTTQSAIDAGDPEAYHYHRFISNEMRVPKSNGVEVPRPAGEVLEAIAELFMASIYQADGRWWVMPRAQVSFTNTSYTLFNYDRSGNNLSGASGQVLLSNFQINPSTATKILRGGRDSYLHPVRSVGRDYRFSGSLSLFETVEDGTVQFPYQPIGEILNEEFSNDLFAALDGTVFTFRWFWQIQQPANSSLTGSERVVRYRFTFRFKVGDLYLERGLTQSNFLPFTICGVEQIPVANLIHVWSGSTSGDFFQTWETDPNARYVIITPPIDARCGQFHPGGGQIQLPVLPSTQEGIEIELEDITPIDADGNEFVTPNVTPTGDDFKVNLSLAILNGSGTDTVGFQAINDNNARDLIQLPEAIFGDQLSVWNTRGAIRRINNTEYTTQEWRKSGFSDQNFINQLLVNTYAEARHKARETRVMTIFSPDVRYFWNRIRYENITWVITSMRHVAALDEYDVELIDIRISGTPLTPVVPGIDNTSPTVPTQPGVMQPDIQGLAQANSETQQIAVTAAEKITGIQPIGQSGMTLKNAPSDDFGVTYTPPAVTSDKSATLPLGFNWFVICNTFITAANQERFIVWNTRDNSASIAEPETFIAPFEGRLSKITLRSALAATIKVRIYINTALQEEKTASIAAGSGNVFDFLSDDVEFNESSRLSLSIESDEPSNEITATAILLQY